MSKPALSLKRLPRLYCTNDAYEDFYALTIEDEILPEGGCHIAFTIKPDTDILGVVEILKLAVNGLEKHLLTLTKNNL